MKFVDEYRDADTARVLATGIAGLCEPGRRYAFMEICGGHTHTIYKHGLEDHLPESITLVHGPGCPVCVIPMGRVDDAIALAEQDDVIMTSFGDMMRVPGGRGSFFDSKAAGADIRMVYSPLDALKIARKNPDKRVIFFAIGFETTTPSTAMTVLRAAAEGLDNFSVFCNHVRVMPAITAILSSPDLQLDGFVGPGHVSTVIGCRALRVHRPRPRQAAGVSGFEPLDILHLDLHAAPAVRRRALRGGEPVLPGGAVGRQPEGARRDRQGDGGAADTSSGAGWAGSRSRPCRLREEYAAFDAERIF